MSESVFKAGDVVKLKSGGPWMTVSGEMLQGLFLCQWFEGNVLMKGEFRAGQLELKPEGDGDFGFA